MQCSEADAHLILSEDNTAARLLTRPGEAIYNDANGMMEGNNLFQVVWLSDERRESYLERIQEMSRERNIQKPPQIVFEGNMPADVSKNPLLESAAGGDGMARSPQGRLRLAGRRDRDQGPDRLVFRPQSGSNVLIVGQNDEAALAMMMMAALSIAAQHPPVGPQASRFYLLDGSPVDSALAGQLGRLKDVLPHPVTNVTWRDLAAMFAELAAEVKRRQENAVRRSGADLYLHLRHPAVPRPPQVGRRFRLLALRRGQARPAVQALRRRPPRRPAGRHPHDRLVRQRQQHEPDASIARASRSSRIASSSR